MSTGPPASFGELLKHYRLARHLTQEALADRAGLSLGAINSLERGARRMPHQETLTRLADALTLSAQERTRLEAAAHQRRAPTSPPLRSLPILTEQAPTLLVGRSPELARLRLHLTGEGPPLLLLAGEPGIGKTRLLQEAAQFGQREGWTVLVGRCQRSSGQEPYAPLVSALTQFLAAQSASAQQSALEGCAWLARLLPELAEEGTLALPPWTLPAEQERRLLFVTVQRFLGQIAGPGGTLLILDDLHWARTDGLELVLFLARTAAATPIRLLGAYRSTELMPRLPLALALEDLAHENLVAQTTLGPLSDAESRTLGSALLATAPGEQGEVLEQITLRAAGVPFFLVSYAQGRRAGLSGEAIPWTVAHHLRQRIALLAPIGGDLLAIAATAGSQIEPAVLLQVARWMGHAEPAILDALEAACVGGILAETSKGYQFAHDLIREVVLADLSVARRQVLHRHLAEALEQATGELPVERLANHYHQAGILEKAAFYLERAGDRAAAVQAHTDAEQSYRALVETCTRSGHRSAVAAAQGKWAGILTILARYDEALEVLEMAEGHAHSLGDLEHTWQLLAQWGHVHALRGTHEVGLARLLSRLETPENHWSPALAALHLTLAELAFGTAQYGEQLARAERVAEQARATQATPVLVKAQYWQSLALFHLGQLEEGARIAEEVVVRAEEVGDLWSGARALNNIAGAYWARGTFGESRQAIVRALRLAERLGDPALLAFLLQQQANFAFECGQWQEARMDYERAVELIRPMKGAWGTVYCLLGLGRLYLAEGQWAAAAAVLEEGLALAERRNNREALRLAQEILAERDLIAERPQEAWTRLQGVWDPTDHQVRAVVQVLPLLAWAALEVGAASEAEALLTQATTLATRQGYQLALIEVRRVQALLAVQQGHWAEAEERLEEALTQARAVGAPYREAKLLFTAGQVAARQGERARSAAHLRAAQAILTELGERLYAEQIDHLLPHMDG